VFANAGTTKYASLGEITEELYDSIFGINVKGVLFTVQKAMPLLPDAASIILNASIVPSKGLPSRSVYSAIKAAVRSFARTWTTDLKRRRIRANANCSRQGSAAVCCRARCRSERRRSRLGAPVLVLLVRNVSNPSPLMRCGWLR